MAQLGTVTYKDINGNTQTIDLDRHLNGVISQYSGSTWPGLIATQMSTPYMGLPPDIGSDPRADNSFQSGYNKSMFSPEDQAKLDAYVDAVGGITSKANSIYWNVRNSGPKGYMSTDQARQEVLNQLKNANFSQAVQPTLEAAQVKIQSITPQYAGGTTSDVSLGTKSQTYGATGTQSTSMLETYKAKYPDLASNSTALYNKARLDNPNLTYADFTKVTQSPTPPAPTQPPAGTSDAGTSATGDTNYNTFLGAQQRGFTGSYSDWVAQGRPTGGTTPTAATGSGTTGTPTATTPTTADPSKTALQVLEASPFYQNLPEDQKAILRMTVSSWDPTKEVNMENVLSEFDKIKANTIDPYFSNQVSVFSEGIRRDYQALQRSREMEMEQERALSGQNIRQAREGLEKSGMTFSGKGIEALGAQSAYAQTATPETATPTQTPFGGLFYEGTVNQANRLMSSSSAEKYKQNLEALGRQAESSLGGAGATMIAGYSPLGLKTGSIEAQKQQQYGSTLSSLAGQNYQNIAYKQPADLNAINQQFA